MTKKFKRMNLSDKKGIIKQKEFELQRVEYEKQIRGLKKTLNGKQHNLLIWTAANERRDNYSSENDEYYRDTIRTGRSTPNRGNPRTPQKLSGARSTSNLRMSNPIKFSNQVGQARACNGHLGVSKGCRRSSARGRKTWTTENTAELNSESALTLTGTTLNEVPQGFNY